MTPAAIELALYDPHRLRLALSESAMAGDLDAIRACQLITETRHHLRALLDTARAQPGDDTP